MGFCAECGKSDPDMNPRSNEDEFCSDCKDLVKIDRNALNLQDEAHYWHPDELHTTCESCEAQFTWRTRHHHCRKCGKNVCTRCSSHRYKIGAYGSEQRVCSDCYEYLTSHRRDFIKQQQRALEKEQSFPKDGYL